jgi:hypothetical protein
MPVPARLSPCQRWVAGLCTSLRATASRFVHKLTMPVNPMSSSSLAVKLNPLPHNYPTASIFKTQKVLPFTLVLGDFLLQVAASTNKEMESQIPSYPNLPPQLICQLHNVTMQVSLESRNTFSLT